MRIYFGHSKNFDFLNELYLPIEKNEILKNETLLFPHKISLDNYNAREFYKSIDLFVAEVSYRATGLGIELGWAYDDNTPIYCFYKKGTKPPNNSLKSITNNIIEYNTIQDMIDKIINIKPTTTNYT